MEFSRMKFTLNLTGSILVITIFSSIAGFSSIKLFFAEKVPPNVFIGDIPIGGMNFQEAAKKTEDDYLRIIAKDSIVIKLDSKDLKMDYKIKYADINTSAIDLKQTVYNVFSNDNRSYFDMMINSYFLSKKIVVLPEVLCDSEKLRNKLLQMSKMVDRETKNANIYLVDGKIIKEPEVIGLKMNLNNAVLKIQKSIKQSMVKEIVFDIDNESEINVIDPLFKMDQIRSIDGIISTCSTDIENNQNRSYLRAVVKAINKVWIKGVENEFDRPAEFSLNNCLNNQNIKIDLNDNDYKKVFSTLRAAILKAGVEEKNIKLDKDLKFINTLKNPFVIFANVDDNKININIVGKKNNP